MTGPGWRRRITRRRPTPAVPEPAPTVRVLTPVPPRPAATGRTPFDEPCPDCTPTRPCVICRATGARSTRKKETP